LDGSPNRDSVCYVVPPVRRAIKQRFLPNSQVLPIVEIFRQMTNDPLESAWFEERGNQTPSMKRLSLVACRELTARYGGYARYALCAISKAAGIFRQGKRRPGRGRVVTLTMDEARGTAMDCPRCGERLQAPIRGDDTQTPSPRVVRDLRGEWKDRDLIAVLNISRRGRLTFDHSSKEGEAGEL
jgi:hypothetical protein